MSKKLPDKPGNVIPHILINPQKKIKIRFLFSIIGSEKLRIKPKLIPIKKIIIFNKLVFFVLLIITYKLPNIKPKNRDHTYNL